MRGAIDWLALAASPTFAAMALLEQRRRRSGVDDVLGGTPFLPLNGMALMYLLMSAFHATPWLRAAWRATVTGQGVARRLPAA